MADSAVATTTDNTKHAPKEVAPQGNAHITPTNHDMAAAASARPQDKTGGGKIDVHGSLSMGDTASLYPNQKIATNPESNTEIAAAATPAAPGSAEKNLKPGQEVKPDQKIGVDAARDSAPATGDPPAKRSNEISYTKTPEHGEKEVQEARQKLEKAENAPGMRADLKEAMQKHMDDLEHRQPPVTAEQVAGVYTQAARLLENKEGSTLLTDIERQRLATDVMSNAAQQHEIDQGMHNTCNVTTIEEALNRQSPDRAAKFVVDVALNGQFTSGDRQIHVDPSSLKPDAEANIGGTSSANGDRNFASQVFDMGAVNDYWQHHNPPAMYTQERGRGQADTGERLRYLNGQEMTGPDGQPIRQPALGTKAMAQISQHLGLDSNIISTKEFQQSDNPGAGNDVRAENYAAFKDALTGSLAKKDGTAIVFLNGHDKTLFPGMSDKGGAAAAGHVVTVSDYKAGPPEQVYMRNQWGAENNKWVSVQDLYNASIPPKSENHISDVSHAVNKVDSSQSGDNTRSNTHNGSGSGGQGAERGTSRNGGAGGGETIYNRGERVMTDKQYEEWEKKIKKEEPPAANTEKAHQNKIDYDTLYSLMPRLEEARAKKDNNTASALQSQIDNLLSSGN